MKTPRDQINGCCGAGLRRTVQLVLVFSLVTACSYHPPAPIEDQSTATEKRQVDSEGNYLVRRGDTLYGIAFNYGLDTNDLADWNGISSPYTIYPGQKLRLSAPQSTAARKTGAGSVQISTIKPPAKASTRAATSPATDTPKVSSSKPAGTGKAPEPPSKTTATPAGTTVSAEPARWIWPTNGRVRNGYVAGNPARNGLDIAGTEGQPVIATAAGEVVYSGNGLIGYGELIIIKHSEKMLSAYAHNKVRLAREGETVTAGQKIAEMGTNPGGQANLHFEIRVNGKPVNPLNYLPKN